jgi:small-conductance mechanosensitive channel
MNAFEDSHYRLVVAVALGAAIALGLILQRLLFAGLRRALRNRDNFAGEALLRRGDAPAAFALPLLAVLLVVPYLTLPPLIEAEVLRLTAVATTIVVAWFAVAAIGFYADLVKQRYDPVLSDLHARQIRTRIDILTRSAVTIVVLVTVALIAFSVPPIRALGTTLLASAGVAGIAFGIAARPLFENLIAGVEIALSQPIRLNDTVFVEGEQGLVEEIASTFVVVRLSDQRRMMLPLTYFIEKPFQNWSRSGAESVGAVVLYVDFAVPVDAVRAQLGQVLAGEPGWDGKVQSVLVTGATETTMELRLLIGAGKSNELFNLRCRVRERMLAWLHQTYPKAVPAG